MIKFLIEKEFKQLFRNSFLPKLIFIFPCMIMILMPWAANLEIKNINLNIVDNDHSVLSRRLVDKIGASTYFCLTALPDTYDEALLAIEAGSADVVLEIPRDFEKDWVKGEAPRLLVAANAVNGTKGSLGGSYLSSIISDYTRELGSESSSQGLAGKPLPIIRIGLHSSPELKKNMIAGAFHDSFGEIVKSRFLLNQILKNPPASYEIFVNPKTVSQLKGQQKRNIYFLMEAGYNIKVTVCDKVAVGEIKTVKK